MKNLFLGILLVGSFFSGPLYACMKGDTSKILLVIPDTQEGEENAVVGEIRTNDGSVQILRNSYELTATQGDWIYLTNRWAGLNFKFNRQHVRDAGFCYQAIFSE